MARNIQSASLLSPFLLPDSLLKAAHGFREPPRAIKGGTEGVQI